MTCLQNWCYYLWQSFEEVYLIIIGGCYNFKILIYRMNLKIVAIAGSHPLLVSACCLPLLNFYTEFTNISYNLSACGYRFTVT
jgi:hypothetical protein